MPRMDGITATRKIRALGFSGLIIAVTGNVVASDVDEFIQAGANRVLGKPVRKVDIEGIVNGEITTS